MSKVQTRSSPAPLQYSELSPPRRGRRTADGVQDSLIKTRRAKSIPPPASPVLVQPFPFVFVRRRRRLKRTKMARAFAAFDQGSPLNLTQHDPIPVAALKSLPYFSGEEQTTPTEHIQDVANLCALHHVTEDNIAVRLLAASFKGKALEWYRRLAAASITDWDQLGTALCDFFKDTSDHLSLMEQLSTIKRAPHEQVSDFNFRFQKTWERIPVTVRPSAEHAFLYFLRAFNSNIAVMIQSLGGNTLLDVYLIAIREKNNLIQAGQIAPRPAMPIFLVAPRLPLVEPLQVAPLAAIPAVPALPSPGTSQNALQTDPSAHSNELQDIKGLLQNFGNEIVNIKKQQSQNYRPYQ